MESDQVNDLEVVDIEADGGKVKRVVALIALLAVVVALTKFKRRSGGISIRSKSPSGKEKKLSGFRQITDPEERERIERIVGNESKADIHLGEGESTRLPSGTVVTRTNNGLNIRQE